VVPDAEFQKWLKELPEKTEEPEGLTILKKNACNGCHSLDGSKLVSSSFKGLYGKTETVITDGKERQVVIDDEYLKTSIYEPEKDLVKGFPKGVMKSYKGLIKEDELNKVIEYLKTLK
jgi:cytochrome c oxidase subunit 2